MQLDLFQWAKDQSKLSDTGGRCSWCLEDDNWLIVHEHLEEYAYGWTFTTSVVCQTPRLCLDTGEFVELCGKTKEHIEVSES